MLKKISPLLLLCSFELFAGSLRVAPIANDDYASVTVGGNLSTFVIPSANDRYGSVVSLSGSSTGQYGFLQLTGTGISTAVTYTLYDNDANASLAAGQVVTDTFSYSYANDIGQSASAQIIIHVKGTQKRTPAAPAAQDDYASVVVGVTPSAVGNLSTNDLYGSIVTIDGSAAGQYGYLQLSDTKGSYIYTLYDNVANANLAAGQVFTDTFTYKYGNALGQSASARLIVQVAGGQQQKPVAIDDNASVIVGISPSATVNLTTNDRYGSIVTIDGSTAGRYGFLREAASGGSYVYTLYDNGTNAALAAGQVYTDIFTYTYANRYGQSASARLIINVTSAQQTPVAIDDNVTLVPNNTVFSVSGSVKDNDKNGTSFSLDSSPASNYGNLILNSDGSFTYTLYKNSTSVTKLKAGEVVTDSFAYSYVDQYGKSAAAKLNIKVIGNPVDANGNTIFEPPADTPLDNVDVEFNNRSVDATPLNSGRNIKGSLYDGEDKDWYYLTSDVDEIIKLDLCPTGSSCFGKKSWVVYVFDSQKLTTAMEEASYTFRRWVDETGGSHDLTGTDILGAGNTVGTSNHLYLNYKLGAFEGALIGVIDPCFDNASTLEIGVGKPSGPRNYYIAVSSTLMGGDAGKPTGKCGEGTIVLRRPSVSAAGRDADNKPKTYTTTEEYITAFPFSDDQYAINITGTGKNPLLATKALARAAAFNANTGELTIPQLRVSDALYNARLALQNQSASGSSNARNARGTENRSGLKFTLSGIQGLKPEEIVDAYRATYNRVNQQLLIPRVTDTVSGNAYSVVMQYHQEINGKPAWLEVIDYVLIQ